jgi:hypothetical protein
MIVRLTGQRREPKLAEVRFTGWGAKVAIKAPPADEVTTKLEGDDRPPLPPGPKR